MYKTQRLFSVEEYCCNKCLQVVAIYVNRLVLQIVTFVMSTAPIARRLTPEILFASGVALVRVHILTIDPRNW